MSYHVETYYLLEAILRKLDHFLKIYKLILIRSDIKCLRLFCSGNGQFGSGMIFRAKIIFHPKIPQVWLGVST